VDVTIQPGAEGYPGIDVNPVTAKVWDLSSYGHVEARIVNTGTTVLGLGMRVDNDSASVSEPWNSEVLYLKPGEAGTAKVIFGYSWGKPGYALNPHAIARVKLFVSKDDAVRSFRIESLEAAGPAGEKKPVDPESIRTQPANGVIFGAGAAIDAAKQIAAAGAKGELADGGIKATFPVGSQGQVSLKPPVGRWDLSDALEVRVALRNDGSAPVAPKVRVDSNAGPSNVVTAGALAPGARTEVVVPFARSSIAWTDLKGVDARFGSDSVAAIVVLADSATDARSLVIESVKADIPPTPQLPSWLGQRPPVEGQWTKTFEDNFDGSAVDQSKWQIYAENYWDKRTHFTKDNAIVKDGLVRLRYEKKTGHENDDPARKTTDYACGYLSTYGKWVQRYGYFEARMKLPTAPGLWPAFWMMPDRGADKGPQWVRASTETDGMEFDIMEHLTRWGQYRYDIAQHWDGYAENHKSNGTDAIYVQPDKDGFITAGLLWTPGSIVYYCNGKEVARWENARIGSAPSNLIIDMVSGGWDNSDLDDAKLPSDFVIDYVRCWQRKDLAGN
jgi:beta-glucanase (GH16 family)